MRYEGPHTGQRPSDFGLPAARAKPRGTLDLIMGNQDLQKMLVRCGDEVYLALSATQLGSLGLEEGTTLRVAVQGPRSAPCAPANPRTKVTDATKAEGGSAKRSAGGRVKGTAVSVKPGDPSPDPMEGKPIPDFVMQDQDGNEVSAASLRGQQYVLYFYPKDDTPGCTKEACGIRDQWDDFTKAGVAVYGVSKDAAGSHQKFRAKYDLPFPLLTADEAILDALGVWKEKSMYGRTYMGINRETLVVGADGIVKKHYPKVKPAEHAAQILADLSA